MVFIKEKRKKGLKDQKKSEGVCCLKFGYFVMLQRKAHYNVSAYNIVIHYLVHSSASWQTFEDFNHFWFP